VPRAVAVGWGRSGRRGGGWRARGRRSRLAASLERATASGGSGEGAGGQVGPDGGASSTSAGGSSSTRALKCLHAHVAFALAHPEYELGTRIIDELAEPLFPGDACCLDVAG
jgi:hypothetical protein